MNVKKLHKYNDFWDTLVKDLDHIEKKARGEADDDENEGKGSHRNSAFSYNQRTRWTESMEVACWKRRIRREKTMMEYEAKKAAKAALIMRQEALRLLLEKEQHMWETELNSLGIRLDKDRL